MAITTWRLGLMLSSADDVTAPCVCFSDWLYGKWYVAKAVWRSEARITGVQLFSCSDCIWIKSLVEQLRWIPT